MDVNKFKELRMDAKSLYLGLVEKELEDCIPLEKRAEWERLRSKDCKDGFNAGPVGNFIPERVVSNAKKIMTRESLRSSKGTSDAQKCYVNLARFPASMIIPQTG